MKFIAKLIVAVVVNAIGILAAAQFISDFRISGDFKDLVWLALILTVLNYILKPILKLILGPIIILTLGLGLIVVNAVVLYVLDISSQNLTIQTIPALIYASIIIGIINFIFHLATRNESH